MSPCAGLESPLISSASALHNLRILPRRGDAGCAVVMFFGDPAIDMLEDAAGEIGIVTCVGIDRGDGTRSNEMRADCDTQRQARGLGYGVLDGGISHALTGIGR